ncbi:MAG TPA: hypothetical protein VLB46_12430, partial [Pyrinomonadaceae bacterium]|nr:hypothetical protein [Pyrinomonadaceae bacterium]
MPSWIVSLPDDVAVSFSGLKNGVDESGKKINEECTGWLKSNRYSTRDGDVLQKFPAARGTSPFRYLDFLHSRVLATLVSLCRAGTEPSAVAPGKAKLRACLLHVTRRYRAR